MTTKWYDPQLKLPEVSDGIEHAKKILVMTRTPGGDRVTGWLTKEQTFENWQIPSRYVLYWRQLTIGEKIRIKQLYKFPPEKE
jgi:hypothetical protein